MKKKNYSYNKVKRSRLWCWTQADLMDNYGPNYVQGQKNVYYILWVWDRNIRTQNERRQNCHAEDDGYRVRGKRKWKHIRHKWDDPRVARYAGKSWKDYTKAPKQYMKNH